MIVAFSVPDVFGSKKQKSMPSQEALLERFDEYLRRGQFDKAESYYQNTNLNLNALVDKTQNGSKSARGSRLLINYIQECNYQVVDFLLNQGANINLPSIEVFQNVYAEELTEGFDLEDQSQLDRSEHYVYKKYPIGEAVSCPESDIFYRLFKEGASQPKLLLYGAIKWSDKALIKNLIADDISVDFIPDTHDTTILDMLVPYANGKQFGELKDDEGGIYNSELMEATYHGDVIIVKFILDAGADPNSCLFVLLSDDDGRHYDSASTALSIAREQYKITKKKDYKEIIKLLEQHGAKDILKC